MKINHYTGRLECGLIHASIHNKVGKNMAVTKYTDDMVAKIVAQEPLDLDKAKILAVEFGMPDKYRSVISKALSLGLAYNNAKPARKDGTPIARKGDIVADIAGLLHMPEHHLAGLEKATRGSRVALVKQLGDELC